MKNILIYGERGAGKSTLIMRLVRESGRSACGYVTRRLSHTRDGFHPIYIHPAKEYFLALEEGDVCGTGKGEKLSGLQYSESNLIAWCDGKKHAPNLRAFNELGAGYIREAFDAAVDPLIVLDEIGFLESQAEEFQKAVLEALESDIPVIAGVKKYPPCEFTDQLLLLPNCAVYEVTEQNREELFQKLVNML